MALIQCPECGREISDRAHACPHCGRPLARAEEPREEPQAEPRTEPRAEPSSEPSEGGASKDSATGTEQPSVAGTQKQKPPGLGAVIRSSNGCMGCLGCLGLIAIIALISAIGSLFKSPKSQAELIQEQRQWAGSACIPYVLDRLRSPRSADFGIENTTIEGGDVYMVRNYVDAENAFSANIRTWFTCRIRYTGGEITSDSAWTLESLEFDNTQ